MSIETETAVLNIDMKLNIDMNYLEGQIAAIKASPKKDEPVIKTILKMLQLELFICKRLQTSASSIALVPSLRAKLTEIGGEFLEAVEGDLELGKINEGKYLMMAEVAKISHDQCTLLLETLEMGIVIKCNTFNN
jgi:hypothetical protein